MIRARLAHVAYWTTDIEPLAAFWAEVFGAGIGPLYESARRPGFRSRFVRLGGGVLSLVPSSMRRCSSAGSPTGCAIRGW